MIELLTLALVVYALLVRRHYAALRAPRVDAHETRRAGRSRGHVLRSMRPGLGRTRALLASLAPARLCIRLAQAWHRASDAALRAATMRVPGVAAAGMVHTSLGAVDVSAGSTGGAGTSGSPFTGWETRISAATAGSHLVLPDGYYLQTSHVAVPADVTLRANGRAIIRKGFNGNLFDMGNGSSIYGLRLEGQGATYTGGALVFSGTNGSQRINHCQIVDFDSYCMDFAVAAGSGISVHDVEMYRRNSGTGTGRYAVRISATAQLSATPRKFSHVETAGNCAFDFGGCNFVSIADSFLGDLAFMADSRGVHLSNTRVANQVALTIDGHNQTFVGCGFAPNITLAAGSDGLIAGCDFNGTVTDNSAGTQWVILDDSTRANIGWVNAVGPLSPNASTDRTVLAGIIDALPANSAGAYIGWLDSALAVAGSLGLIPRCSADGTINFYVGRGTTTPVLSMRLANNGTLQIDTIGELTAGAGVTIDGVLLKDNKVAAAGLPDAATDAVGAVLKAAALTAADLGALTNSTGSPSNTTIAALPVLGDSPVTADALRDDLANNWAPVLLANFSDLADAYNALRARFEDLIAKQQTAGQQT